MAPFDPRVTAARDDFAAKELEGRVSARRYVEGRLYEIAEPQAPVWAEPRPDASLVTEALKGERVVIYDRNAEGFAWGQLVADNYVGWLPDHALGPPGPSATHKVSASRTLAFPAPSIKLPPIEALPFGARVVISGIDGRMAITSTNTYVPVPHLKPVDENEVEILQSTSRQIRFGWLQDKFHAIHGDLFFARVFANRSRFTRARRNHGVMRLAHSKNDRGKSGSGFERSPAFGDRLIQKSCHLRINSVAND